MDPQEVQKNAPKPVGAPQAAPLIKQKKTRSGAKFALVALAGMFLVGGGIVAAQQFMASPEKVWERALSNTSKGLQSFIQMSDDSQSPTTKIDGSFAVNSFGLDGSVKGTSSADDAQFLVSVGSAGVRVDGEFRLVDVEASDNPDIYMKFDGLEGVESFLGFLSPPLGGLDEGDASEQPPSLSTANGQWYVADHTLLDSAVQDVDTDTSVEEIAIDAQEVAGKITSVLDTYLFTANESTAMVEVAEEYGTEDFEGTSTYKYKAQLNKDHVKDMFAELRESLRDTSFAQSIVSAAGMGESYDDLTDLEDLYRSLDNMDFSQAVADVWTESKGAYVRNVRIYEEYGNTEKSYIDIGVPYEGGEDIPVQMQFFVNENDAQGEVTLALTVNRETESFMLTGDIDVTEGGSPLRAEMALSVSGSDQEVDIETPSDARNFYELLNIASTAFYGDLGLDSYDYQDEYEDYPGGFTEEDLNQLLQENGGFNPQLDDAEL